MKEEEFDRFFNSYWIRACRFACSFVGVDEAEEAAQESFYRIYLRIKRIANIENAEKYLFKTVANVCLKKIRRKKLKRSVIALLKPKEKCDPLQEEFSLKDVWNDFTPSEKEVFYWSEFSGLPSDEVAQRMGIAMSTVRVHRMRLRRKIKSWEDRS